MSSARTLSLELEYVGCDLCGADDGEFLFCDNSFRLVRCRKCHLIYINPRPKGYEVDKIFSGDRMSLGPTSLYYKNYIAHEDGFTSEAKDLLKKINKYAKSGRLLDMGCASGFFLNVARNNGWEAYGIEISQYLSAYAKEKFGLDVYTGTLENSGLSNKYFDVVTMFDLLSHLRSPSRTLKEIYRVMKDGGLLVIKGGNKGELNAKRSRETCWGSPDHLYHFSRKTMRQIIEKSGFKIVNMYSEAVMKSIFDRSGPEASKNSVEGKFITRYRSLLARPYRLFRKISRSSVGRIMGYFPVESITTVYAKKI